MVDQHRTAERNHIEAQSPWPAPLALQRNQMAFAEGHAVSTKENSMSATNRFARGSGMYVCDCCGRKTRSTGCGDNENAGLCAECYDLAGIENAISDGGHDENDLVVGAQLYKAIIEKGGQYDFDHPDKFAPYL